MTTGKTTALTRRTFVGKVMSLRFNMLSMLVITFFPRSKCLLISWLQSPFSVILEPPKIKSDTVSTVSPSISHEVMGPDAMILQTVNLDQAHLANNFRNSRLKLSCFSLLMILWPGSRSVITHSLEWLNYTHSSCSMAFSIRLAWVCLYTATNFQSE